MNYIGCPYQIKPEDYPANEIDPCEFCPLDKCAICDITNPHKSPNAVELITMLTEIRKCIDDVASDAATANTTVLHPIAPDSLRFVIDQCIEYISANDVLIF